MISFLKIPGKSGKAKNRLKNYNAEDKEDEELLRDFFKAAKEGDVELLTMINDTHRIDVDGVPRIEKDCQGLTPLHMASRHNQADAVKFLISAGADVNVSDNFQFRPIHDAALYGNDECLDNLLEAGARIDGVQKEGFQHLTPLFYAVQQNNIGCVKSLKMRSGSSDCILWEVCAKRGHASLICVSENDNFPENRLTSFLNFSAQNGDAKFLERVQTIANDNFGEEEKMLALCVAAQHGKVEYLRKLLENGADPNICDASHKTTALHYAARYGHVTCIDLLHQYGSDLNALNNDNWSPLHFAMRQANSDSIGKLIELDCNVNLQGGENMDTALHMALKCGVDSETLKTLLNGNPCLTIRNKQGKLPTELNANEELTALLLQYARN